MRRISITVFVLALVNSAFGLLSRGAVNARALGAHNLGIAILAAAIVSAIPFAIFALRGRQGTTRLND
jgi:hypothetical protein